MIYLASPYSHPDPAVQQARHDAACRCVARFWQAGVTAFSPVVHRGLLDVCKAYTFWKAPDSPLLAEIGALVVLRLDGWEQSVGVAAEIAHAEDMGIPVEYVDE